MSWSKEERRKRAKQCDDPQGFTMKNFCRNVQTRSKKGQKKNMLEELIEEILTSLEG